MHRESLQYNRSSTARFLEGRIVPKCIPINEKKERKGGGGERERDFNIEIDPANWFEIYSYTRNSTKALTY